MLVRTTVPDIHLRYGADWNDYTYVLPRGDGTAIVGGTKSFNDIDPNVRPEEIHHVGGAAQALGTAHPEQRENRLT